MSALQRTFDSGHPTATGHFPGNPIIPGALLLSETLRAIEQTLDLDFSEGQPLSAKFLHPVRPGDTVSIEFAEPKAGTIAFSCTVGSTPVLSGTVARKPV